jgi:hypothetical protein
MEKINDIIKSSQNTETELISQEDIETGKSNDNKSKDVNDNKVSDIVDDTVSDTINETIDDVLDDIEQNDKKIELKINFLDKKD